MSEIGAIDTSEANSGLVCNSDLYRDPDSDNNMNTCIPEKESNSPLENLGIHHGIQTDRGPSSKPVPDIHTAAKADTTSLENHLDSGLEDSHNHDIERVNDEVLPKLPVSDTINAVSESSGPSDANQSNSSLKTITNSNVGHINRTSSTKTVPDIAVSKVNSVSDKNAIDGHMQNGNTNGISAGIGAPNLVPGGKTYNVSKDEVEFSKTNGTSAHHAAAEAVEIGSKSWIPAPKVMDFGVPVGTPLEKKGPDSNNVNLSPTDNTSRVKLSAEVKGVEASVSRDDLRSVPNHNGVKDFIQAGGLKSSKYVQDVLETPSSAPLAQPPLQNGPNHYPQPPRNRTGRWNTGPSHRGGYRPNHDPNTEVAHLRAEISRLHAELHATKEHMKHIETSTKKACQEAMHASISDVFSRNADIIKIHHKQQLKEIDLEKREACIRTTEEFLAAGQKYLDSKHPDLLDNPKDVTLEAIRGGIEAAIAEKYKAWDTQLEYQARVLTAKEEEIEIRQATWKAMAKEELKAELLAELDQERMEQARQEGEIQGFERANMQLRGRMFDFFFGEPEKEKEQVHIPAVQPKFNALQKGPPTMYEEFHGPARMVDGYVVYAGGSGKSGDSGAPPKGNGMDGKDGEKGMGASLGGGDLIDL